MPVRNAERHLAEAIESILGQDFGDFEFLIVDAGSLEILSGFEARDRRNRLVSRSRIGYLVVRSRVLQVRPRRGPDLRDEPRRGPRGDRGRALRGEPGWRDLRPSAMIRRGPVVEVGKYRGECFCM